MAIARDNSATYNTGGTPGSVTTSYTVGAGSGGILLVGARAAGGAISGITYGGTALTLVYTSTDVAAQGNVVVYGMLAPTVGTANVVVSGTGARLEGEILSYTGVNQSLTFDSQGTTIDQVAGATSASTTNVVAANCWAMSFQSNGDLLNSITNATQVATTNTGSCGSTAGTTTWSDTNATVATGNYTITYNLCSSLNGSQGFVWALAPDTSTGASTVVVSTLPLLMVG